MAVGRGSDAARRPICAESCSSHRTCLVANSPLLPLCFESKGQPGYGLAYLLVTFSRIRHCYCSWAEARRRSK